MKKQQKTVGAPGPLGAAPQQGKIYTKWSEITDPKAMRLRLVDMAKKIEKDPKKRKEFVAQGMAAIEHQEAKKKVHQGFERLIADLKPVLERHGVTCFHLVTKQKVDPKILKTGVTGWAASSKNGDSETTLALIGMLTTGINELSGRRLGASRF
jgi:hypothetical protein